MLVEAQRSSFGSTNKSAPLIKNGRMSSYPQFPVPPGGAPHPGNMYPVYQPVQPPPAEPLPYHRLARTYPVYRWWKPIVVGLIALGLYVGMIILATVAFLIAILANPSLDSSMEEPMAALESVDIDMSDPVTFALTMLSLILMIPASSGPSAS